MYSRKSFWEGYQFVSFDVESLFTNVPLKQAVNVILDRIYNHNLIETIQTKRSLKQLLIDSCTKTAFSVNNTNYEKTDGVRVPMGSSLGPVLANIILTEFERVIVSDLVQSGIFKVYRRYVDDTLVLMKLSDIPYVLKKFNSFDKNLNFTVHTFTDDEKRNDLP